MSAVRGLIDLLLWLLCQVPALALLLVFRGAKLLVLELDRCGVRLYYAVCVLRRRVRGAPLWQPHDLEIGVPPPDSPPPPDGGCP